MRLIVTTCAVLFLIVQGGSLVAGEFGLAENALGEYRAIRYENVYTKVPTSGKLVSIRITDNGTMYYICREENGFAVYHLEIRPIKGYEDKLRKELKDKSRRWDTSNPDELLLTKERLDLELRRRIHSYCEAVWVRNEILVEPPVKPAEGQK
ncbi:MAG: hypothetical protein AB1733_12570 [Thermodesulfobacteriota bacterium]